MLQLPAVNTPQPEVVRNKLGRHPTPVPPLHQPELIARAAVDAALRPRREMWIGWDTVKAIVGQRLAPGLLDRLAARRAWDSQTTTRLPPGHPATHRDDNLEAPPRRDLGAHGPFDAGARRVSAAWWARQRAPRLALAGLALAMLAWAVRRAAAT
jgi:hypothetical protein